MSQNFKTDTGGMFGAFSVKEKTGSYSLIFNEYFTHHKIKDSKKKIERERAPSVKGCPYLSMGL